MNRAFSIVLPLLAVALLYVLSIGPVSVLAKRGKLSGSFADTYFYAPIFWLGDLTHTSQLLVKYTWWWEDMIPTPGVNPKIPGHQMGIECS
jgi:hypothetical protein